MKAMAAPISSALAPRPNGSGLSRSCPVVLAAGAVARLSLHERDQAVGRDRAGIDGNDPDAVLGADTAERLREGGQCRVAGNAADIFGVVCVGRVADHVNDHAALALLHQRIEGTTHVHIAEDLEVPGLAPGRLVDIEQAAARNGAGIVHQDVDVGIIAGELVDLGAVGQVGGDRVDAHIRFLRDRGFRYGEHVGATRDDDDVAAFAGENFGSGPADAFRAAGDQRRFAGKFQVHDFPRKN